MPDQKISQFTKVTTVAPTDSFPLIRTVDGTIENLIIDQDNLVSNSTTSTVGLIQLAGDLAGTATSPTVPALANKANLNSPTFTGTVIVPNVTSTDNSGNVANTNFVHTITDPLKLDFITIFMNGSILNKSYSIVVKSSYAFSILELNAYVASGTCNLTLSNNSVPYGTATNLAITSAIQTVDFNPVLNAATNDTLSIVISNTAIAIDLSVGIKIQRI